MRRSSSNKKKCISIRVCNYLESLLEDESLMERIQSDVTQHGKYDHYLPKPILLEGYFDCLYYTSDSAYKKLLKDFNSYGLRIETNIDRFKLIHYRLERNYTKEDGFINEAPDLKVITFSPQAPYYKYLDRYRNYRYQRKYKKDRD